VIYSFSLHGITNIILCYITLHNKAMEQMCPAFVSGGHYSEH